MKILCAMVFVLFSAVNFLGQATFNPADAPKIEIIQQKWRVEVRNPALDEDPFRAVNERNLANKARQDNMRDNELRQRQGKTSEPERVRLRPDTDSPNDASATYIYELKVKNAGQKEIKTVTWDYIFFDSETRREVGRRRFISDMKIEPGKTKNLVVRTAIPPIETVNANKADSKSPLKYAEHATVYTVEYKDGSVWQVVSN